MIIDVKKYLVLGVKEEIDAFFAKAQEVGIAEFITYKPKSTAELPLEIQRLLQAIKILRKLPVKKTYQGPKSLELSDEVAARIIDLKVEVERLSEERRLVESEILRVAPFGDFSLDDVDFIEKQGKCSFRFFCQKTSKLHEPGRDEQMLFIGTDYDLDYFISIDKGQAPHPDKIEMRIDRPLGELQEHLGFVKDSLHQLEAELKGYAGHLEFLHDALLERLDGYHLDKVKKDLIYPLDNALFYIEAWVPQNKTPLLFSISSQMAIHCEEVSIEKEDHTPTYMENKGVAQVGEDLVHIYDTPASSDKDPSTWVFWCFVFFFSIIVNDGGYGLLYLGICLFVKWKWRHLKAGAQRFLRLATILSIGCIVWGVLTSSFFGLQIHPKSWLGHLSALDYLVEKKADYHLTHKDDVYKFWVSQYPSLRSVHSGEAFLEGAVVKKDQTEHFLMQEAFADNILLEFSLIVGMIHIALSLLRYTRRHLAAIGWATFIAGGYLYLPSILKATTIVNFLGWMGKTEATEVGLQVMGTGLVVALLLALIQKRLKGVGEITTLISVFGDVLSYLRLYALGLSTAIMAETFNDLGKDVGLFLGILVIVAGHSITILMGLMTGVIHGLRLNFIEWYHYCFVGGGKLLAPLRRLKQKI